jgi:sugar lactone lactonase YvrE
LGSRIRLLGLLAACCLAAAAYAETLYVVTLRDYANEATSGLGGAIYKIELPAGKAVLVASLKVGGRLPIGLTGLAIHPKTGIWYGITAGLSQNVPRSLVTVDPRTGTCTIVGDLREAGTDIRFDPKGKLYIWLSEPARLGVVDVGTGAATPIGESGYEQTLGGGLAIDRDGTIYVSATNAAGTLDKVDPATGKVSIGPRLTGAPYITSIHSMAFSESGLLYGVNSTIGAPAKGSLIRIDVTTGKVTEVVPLPNDTDALAFTPEVQASFFNPSRETMMLIAAFAAGLVLGVVLVLVLRRRSPQSAR